MGEIITVIRNFSIRSAFFLYTAAGIIIAFFLGTWLQSFIEQLRSVIIDRDSSNNSFILLICNFLSTFSIPLVFALCLFITSFLFYRFKFQKPLKLLTSASENIMNSKLDFELVYDCQDELGRLCFSFEQMRHILAVNYNEMHRTLDERRRINTAFSHDLRTPLAVAKGNCQMLLTYLPENKLKPDQILAIADAINAHLERLEKYTETMSSVQKLEDIKMKPAQISLSFFLYHLKESCRLFIQNTAPTLHWDFYSELPLDYFSADSYLIMEVFDNLLANAVRFADASLEVHCLITDNFLTLTLRDDGIGFAAEVLGNVGKPFFRGSKSADDPHHFGMGLNISKMLCEKHGGSLQCRNRPTKGAEVQATFRIKEL